VEGVVAVDLGLTEEGGMDEVRGLIRRDGEGDLLGDIIIQPVRLAYQPTLIQPEQYFSLTTNQSTVLSAISHQPAVCLHPQVLRSDILP
jgi:hypothetical protein